MSFELITEAHGETVFICAPNGGHGLELELKDIDDDVSSVSLSNDEAVEVADALYELASRKSDLIRASELSVNDALIRVAALHGLAVRFNYSKTATSPIETRCFVPSSLAVYEDHTTFSGHDADRGMFRAFRTDRVKGTVAILGG